MSSTWRYLLFLLWTAGVYMIGIYIFTSGFLLQRQVLPQRAGADRGTRPPPLVQRAVVILVDALRFDFCTETPAENVSSTTGQHFYTNRLPVFAKHSRPDSQTGLAHGKLFKFVADPPTTTMQRLKGLTTGSLPTFIDVSSNFASYEVQEDNLLEQLHHNGKKIYFAGDDTWTSLYPDRFAKTLALPSFDVWDLDTVDRKVYQFLEQELIQPRNNGSDRSGQPWDFFIAHFLGVDHAGHKYGPAHPEMTRKLTEMNTVIERVIQALPVDCILVVMGDHGMTASGDHGGDSALELEAGLFVYGKKLGMEPISGSAKKRMKPKEEPTVAQIDLVPTLSLLLGVPVPFSNLGTIIDELFIPTMLIQNSNSSQNHAKISAFSYEDLIKFRLSYMKNNVEQVYRYLTAYVAAGGKFPDRLNSQIRHLASQVINRPGALNPKQTVELYTNCHKFLQQARSMCQEVWVHFNLQAISSSLTLVVLHCSVLLLLVLKPQTRVLSTLISGFLLIGLGAGILIGSFFGATISVLAGIELCLLVPGVVGFITVLVHGLYILWKFRFSLNEIILTSMMAMFRPACMALFITSILPFSNSFTVLEWRCLTFGVVSLLLLQLVARRRLRYYRLSFMVILFGLTLIKLASIYVRCREEEGPDCVLTDFHRPLSTLPAGDHMEVSHKNTRYFFTLVALFLVVYPLHRLLSFSGNLNGLGCQMLIAKYLPGILSALMASYWALKAFPTNLVNKLLPWQINLLPQMVLGLSFLGMAKILITPCLVYFESASRKRTLQRLIGDSGAITVPTFFNFIKANWKSALQEKSMGRQTVGYGLSTWMSAPLLIVSVIMLLLTMLIAGDGECPAVLIQFLLLLTIVVISPSFHDSQSATVSAYLRVPFPSLVMWLLVDHLGFFTTGHQATFPHIQWSAAFVGLEGVGDIGGDSWTGHIIPATLIGWNTYCSTIISGICLPLLVISPFTLSNLLPSMRPRPVPGEHEANGTGGSVRSYNFADGLYDGGAQQEDLSRGEAALLDRPEETKAAVVGAILQYILLKGLRLVCSMTAAAVLRRHLMVWKIFAPRYIFEGVGFCVSVFSLIIGYLISSRILSYAPNWYDKLLKS